jgi:hypothetical protein
MKNFALTVTFFGGKTTDHLVTACTALQAIRILASRLESNGPEVISIAPSPF